MWCIMWYMHNLNLWVAGIVHYTLQLTVVKPQYSAQILHGAGSSNLLCLWCAQVNIAGNLFCRQQHVENPTHHRLENYVCSLFVGFACEQVRLVIWHIRAGIDWNAVGCM
jgi:hypothetical protein